MKRSSFFKHLLTIIAAPLAVVKLIEHNQGYVFTEGEMVRFSETVYYKARTDRYRQNREWANNLTEEQRASFKRQVIIDRERPSGQCYVIHKSELRKLNVDERVIAIYKSNNQA